MKMPNLPRRFFLSSVPFFITPGLMAETLTLTPKQTEGPFYPDKMPLDTDNDLIMVYTCTQGVAGGKNWIQTFRDMENSSLIRKVGILFVPSNQARTPDVPLTFTWRFQ